MNDFRINKYLTLFICLFITVGNVLVNHFSSKGIDYTPYLIIIAAFLLNFNLDRFNIFLQVVLTYFIIAINDVGIKLYGGGMHDGEGQAFVLAYMLFGAIPALIIIIISSFRNKSLTVFAKITSIALFISLLILHSYLFRNLGIGRYYPTN